MNEPALRVGGSRRERLAAVRLLTSTVRDADAFDAQRALAMLSATTPDALLPLASYHRVGGMLYEMLRRFVEPDHPVVMNLGRDYARAVRDHLRVLWELARMRPALDASGARWAVIKGPALVERLYGAPGRRVYADLDLLADPAAFPDVIGSLEETGARLLDRNWKVLQKDLRGEVHLLLPGGTPLDLHWNLINMNRRRMWIETSELLDRAVEVDLGGVTVWTLEPADTLVHLAVHAGTSGGDRLIWLRDIERVASLSAPSWEAVVERSLRWKVAGPVGFMLTRAVDVLDAPVPPWVLRRLFGRGSATLMRLVDRVSPWEVSVGRLTAANLVLSRSIAHGLAGGTLWLLERGIRNLDPREPAASSAFTPGGDDGDRTAYLDAVVTRGTRHARTMVTGDPD